MRFLTFYCLAYLYIIVQGINQDEIQIIYKNNEPFQKSNDKELNFLNTYSYN